MTHCDMYDVTTMVEYSNRRNFKPLRNNITLMCYNILFYGNYSELASLLNKNNIPIMDSKYVFLYEKDNKIHASEYAYYLYAFSERYKVFA